MPDNPAAPAAAQPLPAAFKPLPPEEMYGTGNVEAERAYRTAESMIASGQDRDRVAAALAADGYDASLLDTRTEAQKSVDKEFGIEHRADASALFFQIPPGTVENVAAFNTDLRDLTTDIGLARDAGNSFASMIVRAIGAQNAEPDLKAAGERHATVLQNVFGDQLPEKIKDVNWLLDKYADGIANRKLVNSLRYGGALARPEVFVSLANRAAKMRLYSAARK